jgi:hypothetical protein
MPGRADDLHAILDAQTQGTLDALEAAMQTFGGRRGRAALVWSPRPRDCCGR